MLLAVDLYEDLVEVPAPLGVCPHVIDPLPSDPGGEHGPEAVPPEPHRLVADIDPAVGQHILDVSERERVFDVHYHNEPDHFRRTVGIAEGASASGLPIAAGGCRASCPDRARRPVGRDKSWKLLAVGESLRTNSLSVKNLVKNIFVSTAADRGRFLNGRESRKSGTIGPSGSDPGADGFSLASALYRFTETVPNAAYHSCFRSRDAPVPNT